MDYNTTKRHEMIDNIEMYNIKEILDEVIDNIIESKPVPEKLRRIIWTD